MVLQREFRVEWTIVGDTEELSRTREFRFPGFRRFGCPGTQLRLESVLHLAETLL